MSGTPRLSIRFFDTGYCLAWEHQALRGGRRRRIHCHALVALLGHPTAGWTLFDTGYGPQMLAATQRFPWRLYRWLTPLRLQPDLAVVAALRRAGIDPADVRRVVVSHFHADHVAGLSDFPNAQFVALRSAYEHVAPLRGLWALRHAVVPALLPLDFAQRALLLDAPCGPALGSLGPTHDLLGDRSLLLVALPGHARGQLGLLAHTERGPVLLAADAAWLRRSYREGRPPARIAQWLLDDPQATAATLARLAAFAVEHPEVQIVPTHCPEAFAEVMGREA